MGTTLSSIWFYVIHASLQLCDFNWNKKKNLIKIYIYLYNLVWKRNFSIVVIQNFRIKWIFQEPFENFHIKRICIYRIFHECKTFILLLNEPLIVDSINANSLYTKVFKRFLKYSLDTKILYSNNRKISTLVLIYIFWYWLTFKSEIHFTWVLLESRKSLLTEEPL